MSSLLSPLSISSSTPWDGLPGVGPKSAQRMALHLLESNREGGAKIAETLAQAIQWVKHCQQCRILCEVDTRKFASPKRDVTLCCVVESPADVLAIEQTGLYRGRYVVLRGHFILDRRRRAGGRALTNWLLGKPLGGGEVIMATNSTGWRRGVHHYMPGN